MNSSKLLVRLLLIVFPVLLGLAFQIAAQTSQMGELSYGETVLGRLDSGGDSLQEWTFQAEEREMFSVELQRIGGQFNPSLELVNPAGQVLNASQVLAQDADRTWLFFAEAATAGNYLLRVNGAASDNVDNPNEYSLSLYYEGRHLENLDEGLTALPRRSAEDMPNLQEGTSRNTSINIPSYGNAQISQPDERNQRNRWVLAAGAFSIDMDNANPLNRGIASFSILEEGLGFTSVNGQEFFSDISITALSYAQSIVEITLEDGRTIRTDFYRIRQIQVFESLLILTTINEQRLILEGRSFEFLRRGGLNGEGPNTEAINVFTVDGYRLETDLSLWHTLYYNTLNPELRLLYGTDMRFISSYLTATIAQRGNQEKPELNTPDLNTSYVDISLREANVNNPRTWLFEIDPFGMGDVQVSAENITVSPLDEREISENTSNIQSLLIENRAIRFSRIDASYRLSLPDGTDIGTPNASPSNRAVLPNASDYRPSNANNLGTTLYDYHPHMSWDEFLLPVNPVNGNFFYSVEDIAIPSHAIALNWTRYYNSLSLASLTPSYMLNANRPYLFGQMGQAWRHSYQYELNIQYAPLGEVWLILPDASQHIFRGTNTLNASNPSFRSSSLMSWEIRREGGITGYWVARNGDGEIYEFDRAGRLRHIRDLRGNVLLFSPAPRELVAQHEQSGGFFVTERYGRRIEVYSDATNKIRLVRQQYEYRYDYDGELLVQVQYPSFLQNLEAGSPNYNYQSGLLVEIRDRRSPYHPEMALSYAQDGRVTAWTINIDERGGMPAIRRDLSYSNGQTITSLSTDSQQQLQLSYYDSEQRITTVSLSDGTNIRNRAFTYDAQTGRLYQVKQVNGGNYSFVFDEQGYLTSLRSPRGSEYRFTYRQGLDGISRWLLGIDYPAMPNLANFTPRTAFTYDENTNLLMSVSQAFERERSLLSNYEYDEFGRVFRVLAPNATNPNSQLVSEYSYDSFGYPSQVQVYDSAQADIKQTLSMRFDFSGRLIEINDWRGQAISIQWDNERNLMTAYIYGDVARLVNRTEFSYDEYSHLVERRSQDLVESFTYNGLGLLASSSDGMGRVSNYRYDIFGNLIEKIVPAGATENSNTVQIFQYRYNGLNELVQYILPNQESYAMSYEIAGTGIDTSMTVQAPDGQSVRYTYNVDNLLSLVTQFDSLNRKTYEYSLDYDLQGNLSTLTELIGNGRTLQISYNAARLPISSRIDNVETLYEYNPVGLLSRIIKPDGGVSEYFYDTWGNISRVLLPDNDASEASPAPSYSYLYDEADNLISFTDALGNSYTYTYDELNRLVSVNDPLGFETRYEYDSRDNIISVTYPNGTVVRAEYNNANLMTQFYDAMGEEVSYAYDQSNRLTQMTESGNLISNFTYDALGNLIANSVTDRRQTLYSYDNANRLISETNALGQTNAYNYNNYNRISQVTDSLGNIERYTWSGSGRLINYSNQRGQSFDYSPDEIGRLAQMNTPDQLERFIFDYMDSGLLESLRHVRGNNEQNYEYRYYPNGTIASIKLAEMDAAWQFSYDNMQRLTSLTSPEAEENRYSYDALGRLLRIDYPDGGSESWEYDSVGNVTRHVAPNATVSTFQYDANNRVNIRREEANGLSREYRYQYSTTAPQLVIIDSNNYESRYYYDEFGNIERLDRVANTDEGEQTITYRYDYDSLDNLEAITLPAIGTDTVPVLRFSYNALNQLTRYIDASGGSWAYGYDVLGNLNQVNDPLGNVVNYQYDVNNRITSIQYSNGAYAEFRYNLRDSSLTANENRSNNPEQRQPIFYEFDFNQRLRAIEHSTNSRITFERDDLGRVESMRTANGANISFEYNYRGQITATNSPDGNTTRQYDNSGNLLSSSSNGQNFSFTYDGFGNLTEFEQANLLLNYEWDIAGNLLAVDSSSNGETTYSYDGLYRLVGLQNGGEILTIRRNEMGWLTQAQYESGLMLIINYTPTGRIATLVYQLDRNSISFNYQYDAIGNLIRSSRSDRTENSSATRNTLYTYGRNNELIGERWLNENNEVVYAVTYSYDLAGNRIQSITYDSNSNPIRTLYIYNPTNQLIAELRGVPADIFDRYTGTVLNTEDSDRAQFRIQYEYDNAGNLIRLSHPLGNLSYSYDAWNRLIAVTGTDENGLAVNTSIQYNTLGQIQTIVSDGIRYSLLYDRQHLQSIVNESEGTRTQYHYSPDGRLLWRLGENGTEYPIIDGLGNIRLWIDSNGNSVDGTFGISMNAFGAIIKPYGENSGQALPNSPQLLYGGQIYEAASSLHMMGVRAYMPSLGRFIQRDPVRHDPQSSLYTYVQNRPTYALDLSGMVAELGFSEAEAILYPVNNFSNQMNTLVPEETREIERVVQAQALEDARLLSIAHSLRHDFNQSSFQLDAAFCLSSLGGLKHQRLNLAWLPNLMLEGQSNAWIPNNSPSPHASLSRTNALDSVNAYVFMAFNNLHPLNEDNCNWQIEQAQTGYNDPFTAVLAHGALRHNLEETPMYAALAEEVSFLTDGNYAGVARPHLDLSPNLQHLPLPSLLPSSLYAMQLDNYSLTQAAILPFYTHETLLPNNQAQSLAGFSFETYIWNALEP